MPSTQWKKPYLLSFFCSTQHKAFFLVTSLLSSSSGSSSLADWQALFPEARESKVTGLTLIGELSLENLLQEEVSARLVKTSSHCAEQTRLEQTALAYRTLGCQTLLLTLNESRQNGSLPSAADLIRLTLAVKRLATLTRLPLGLEASPRLLEAWAGIWIEEGLIQWVLAPLWQGVRLTASGWMEGLSRQSLQQLVKRYQKTPIWVALSPETQIPQQVPQHVPQKELLASTRSQRPESQPSSAWALQLEALKPFPTLSGSVLEASLLPEAFQPDGWQLSDRRSLSSPSACLLRGNPSFLSSTLSLTHALPADSLTEAAAALCHPVGVILGQGLSERDGLGQVQFSLALAEKALQDLQGALGLTGSESVVRTSS
jgi:hypothetical protein